MPVTIACLIIILVFLKWSADFTALILFAFVLSVLSWPIIQWFRKKGMSHGLAIVTIIFLIVIGVSFLILILNSLGAQFVERLPHYQQQFNKQVSPLQEVLKSWNITMPRDTVQEIIKPAELAKGGFEIISSLLTNTTNVFLFLLILFFMIIASDGVVKKFHKRFRDHDTFASNFAAWSNNIQQQYRVQTLNNLIIAILAGLIFWFFKIDFAGLWAFFTFILAYIPNIGTTLAAIPPAVLAFILYGPWTAIIVIALLIVINLIMDNFVTPRFVGKQLNISPAFVFFSFIFWSWIFGALGIFLSLPITLAMRTFFASNRALHFLADLLTDEKKS